MKLQLFVKKLPFTFFISENYYDLHLIHHKTTPQRRYDPKLHQKQGSF